MPNPQAAPCSSSSTGYPPPPSRYGPRASNHSLTSPAIAWPIATKMTRLSPAKPVCLLRVASGECEARQSVIELRVQLLPPAWDLLPHLLKASGGLFDPLLL